MKNSHKEWKEIELVFKYYNVALVRSFYFKAWHLISTTQIQIQTNLILLSHIYKFPE